jgi:predicted ATPase/DNA-binding CsgD family transcriptional regulator
MNVRSEGGQLEWARAQARYTHTRFIGRVRELAEVREAVNSSRVVTLTGPGGVGKTRIALQSAQDLDSEFPGGVKVVELSGLRDGEFLPNTVASAVGLPETAGTQPIDQLIQYFTEERALLVLDTCEHLIDAVALFTESLVSNAPDLVVMLTSRQSLALADERVLDIAPMPEPHAHSDATNNDTLKLFTVRAQAARSSFELCDDNRAEVVALCRRLEGIPLAIELAAARLRKMPLEQILRRIDNRFQALAGARTARTRHQTLWAAIAWSHDLCDEAEQELWARLSVFAGGFSLEAAQEVCQGGALDGSRLFETLGSLVDKSVVQYLDGTVEPRYRMLDTIREFGADMLADAGGSERYARRHQEFFLHTAVQAGQEWFGDLQTEWNQRLAADLDNFRLAMEFATQHPGDEVALRLVTGLSGLWQSKSRLTEGRRWISRALQAEPQPTVEHGLALWYGAYYGMVQGDREALELHQRCGEVAELLDDDFLRGRFAANEVYAIGLWGQDVARTMDAFAHSRPILRSTHDQFALVASFCQSSAVLAGSGDPAWALAEVEEGLREVAHIPREQWLRSYLLAMKVLCLWALGELDAARDLGRSVLAAAQEHGDTMSAGVTVEYLAWVACSKGEHEVSAALLGGAGALWRQVGALLWGEKGLNDLHATMESTLLSELGEARFNRLYTYGAELSPSALLKLAGEDSRLKHIIALRSIDGSPLGPLTRREREVTQLIAEGLSNRGIAERLVISKRTADTHVEHILSKLGFTSRSQVAEMVAELGKNPSVTDAAP